MKSLLIALSLFCFRYSKLSIVLLGLSGFLSFAVGGPNLGLEVAWTYLFEKDDPIVREFEEARRKFPYPGDIAVLVDQGTSKQRELFLEQLASRMEKDPKHFHHLLYKIDLKSSGTRALYYLDEEFLENISSVLAKRPLASGQASNTAQVFQLLILENLKSALDSRGRERPAPLWQSFLKGKDRRLSTLVEGLMGQKASLYSTIAEGKVHFLLFKGGTRGSALASSNGEEVRAIRALLKDMAPQAFGLRVRLTGLPVMLFDERQTCAKDSVLSAAVSLVLVVGIFCLGFGGLKKPFFCLSSLLVGLAWTTCYAWLTVGNLNFITVSMVSMLLGLGVDFGIHLLFRFEEEVRGGLDGDAAMIATLASSGFDTFVGALATAAAFFALGLSDFRGVSDLGILAGGGILLCFFSSVTVLPAILGAFPSPPQKELVAAEALQHFEKGCADRPRLIVGVVVIITVLSLMAVPQVGFSYNLLSVQDPQMESVITEKEMIRDYRSSVLTGAVLAKDLAQARDYAQRLRKLSTVKSVNSIGDLIPQTSAAKQDLIEKIVKMARALRTPRPVPLESAQDLLALKALLERTPMSAQSVEVREALNEVRKQLQGMKAGPIQDSLQGFQAAVLDDSSRIIELLRNQQADPPTARNLPAQLLVRSLSPEGTVLMTVVPKYDIWQRENLQKFLAEIASCDITMVGHPVVQNHLLTSFDRAFQQTPFYTLLGVLTVMGVYLRSFSKTFWAVLPTSLGLLFVLAGMWLLDLQFNVVNFVALPISVGIGAVFGVHALHRLQADPWESFLATSTGYSILLSGLTTIAGFISLALAHHQGLRSLGLVISMGVAANLVVSLLVLPAFFRVLSPRPLPAGRGPKS